MFFSPKPKTEAMVRSPPVVSPSTAAQSDSKMPNQGKPGSTGSQSQPSPCDPKTKGAQNVAGGVGLKNGQSLSSGPSSKVKSKRSMNNSAESSEQPESGTPTSEETGKNHHSQYSIIKSSAVLFANTTHSAKRIQIGHLERCTLQSLIASHIDKPKATDGFVCACVCTDSSRAKRICVTERRAPYSGADWYSGGESDEDNRGFFSKCVNMCIQAYIIFPPLINLT